jgi:hypothetical protein
MVPPGGNDIAPQRTESWYMAAAVLVNCRAGRNCKSAEPKFLLATVKLS